MPSINNFLSAVFNGATHPKGTMGDFQHAARLYGDNTFALAPKSGWMYYVFFSINPSAKTLIGNFLGGKTVNRDLEAGMLVKAADLPKFQVQTEQLNQYNRRTVVQTKINYQPVSLTFHDDQSNITNSLWWNYYRYYYRDSTYGQVATPGSSVPSRNPAFANTKYQAYTGAVSPTGYGLNNNQGEPFFNSIIIYQLNRKFFTSYILVNPIISGWDHDRLDQASGSKTAESKMTIQYESVFYGQGQVKIDNPPGFATFHYDLSPSPLSIAGGGTGTLFGPGGIIAGATEIFGDIENMADGNVTLGGVLGTAIKGANLIKNAGSLNKAGVTQEVLLGATGIITGLGTARQLPSASVPAGTGGVGGVALTTGYGFNPGTTNASQGSVLSGGIGAALGLGGAALAATSLLGKPVNSNSLPSDSTSLTNQLTSNQTELTQAQELLAKNQSLQASFTKEYQSALAAGGQDAANDIATKYANLGYTDPSKLSETVQTLQTNQDLLTRKLSASQAITQSNPYLSGDQDTEGSVDPSASLNTAINADSNITEQPVKIAGADIPDTYNWSI